jgi:hypothetical protein
MVNKGKDTSKGKACSTLKIHRRRAIRKLWLSLENTNIEAVSK